MPESPHQYKLELSEYWTNEYKKKYNREPAFHYKAVEFGLEDNEVVVAAVLPGSNLVPQWEFSRLFKGESGLSSVDQSSDAKASLGLMNFDLCSTAVR
ncbi:uncharacterized protein LY89DRAFT_217010 [Mollisia scopiformis]|uniref:Uncharacterized protein n=1 Tax=Mollisia scopiformis TaxID=149040 RepID=A0A194WVG0_MOLSC|nr:uncharacterized protein LY89DRAFT_217010 [Mollisia scopiformis]KUJ11955.1 hypothetical protein LY89DRAFT_217010 [Mollisia scopiformis]